MDDYLKVLLLVGSRLDQAGIPYMLSGSTAMNFYARPRMTRDVDIVIELGMKDVGTVVKVDCVVRKRAAYRQEEFHRRRPIEVQGQRIWIVAPEDLILSKLYWARESLSELQLGDVRNILEAVPSLDWAYMEHWARELGIEPMLERVKR